MIDSHEFLEPKRSVGKQTGCPLHILDEKTEEELPVGETGVVYFDGGSTYEYHKAPDKAEDAKSKQGYTTLGDVGYSWDRSASAGVPSWAQTEFPRKGTNQVIATMMARNPSRWRMTPPTAPNSTGASRLPCCYSAL